MLDQYAERWALITGASSGIGAEFARKLAGRGMHLVLTARRADKLDALAQELDTAHGTKTIVLAADLSAADTAEKLIREIDERGITIELLVNNAGAGVVGSVEETDPADVLRMLQLNIVSLADLTYRLLPRMLENRHGGILNVSSLSAFQPVAWMAAYAASKSWVLHFSEALWAEVRDRGVTVTAVCPGATKTEFFAAAGIPNWLEKRACADPSRVVKYALRALEARRQYVVPGWRDFLITVAVRLTTRRTAVKESMKFFRPQKKTED